MRTLTLFGIPTDASLQADLPSSTATDDDE
jgi:hypothetical protein